jgi:hypothetical protein
MGMALTEMPYKPGRAAAPEHYLALGEAAGRLAPGPARSFD